MSLDKLYALVILRQLNQANLLEMGNQKNIYYSLENILRAELIRSNQNLSDFINNLYEKEKTTFYNEIYLSLKKKNSGKFLIKLIGL